MAKTDAPSFRIDKMTPEELGQLFVDVAAGIVKATGSQPNSATIITNAVNAAALFCETIADIQRKQ